MKTIRTLVVEDELKGVNVALDHFGIPKGRTISLLHGGFNSNWYVKAKNREYVLKRRSKEERAKSQKEVLLQGILKERINTARPVFASDNKTLDVIDGEWCYTLFEYVDGRKYDGRNGMDFSLAVGALARLHARTSDFLLLVDGVQDINWNSMEWARHYVELCELGKAVDPAIINTAKKHLEEARWSIEMIKKSSKRNHALPESLVHWDYHGGNIRIKGNDVYIFDFEFTHMESRVADIANSAIIFAALDESKLKYEDAATFIQSCTLDVSLLDKFLGAYMENADSPLSKEEAAALPHYLQIAWLGWCFYTFHKMPASRTSAGAVFDFVDWVRSNSDLIVSHVHGASK